MRNKKQGISLIVLVITVIVIGILVTAVIINLNSVSTIEEAGVAVDKYNKNQLETSIQLKTGEMVIANDGKLPNTFELVEELHSNKTITDNQKTELIANGGKLKIGEEVVRIDTSSVIRSNGTEAIQTDDTWKLRFSYVLKKISGVEYTEFGTLLLPKDVLEYYYPETGVLDKFNLESSEEMTAMIIEANNYVYEQEQYSWNANLTNMPEEEKTRIICTRSYAKYTYNGIEGIIYSDVVEASVENLLNTGR